MKTKLLALMLLAGGSMFAQTRFSVGINIGGNGRGYYQPVPPPYSTYQTAPRYEQRSYDNCDNNVYVNSYHRDSDRDERGGNGYRGRVFNQNRDRDDHRGNEFRNH